jgi:hypothetical protein
MWLIYNVGTEKVHGPYSWLSKHYDTERGAKSACTKLNKKYGNTEQWKISTVEEWSKRPVKMVERVNLMSGEKFMEAEDTPNFCSPASEAYWSM